MRKNPQDRYPDAGALAGDLEYRWQHCLLGPRFARLSGLATLALALLSGLWLMTHGWGLGPPALPFAGTEPTTIALLLLEATLFFGGGVLALGAALAWLGAWTRHTDRPAGIVATVCALAAAACAGWLLAPAGGLAAALTLAVAPVLSLAAAVAVRAWHARWSDEMARKANPDGPTSRPFMQRLIAASAQARRAIEARQDEVARVSGPAHVALGDFELGRVLRRWPHGLVQRGRQKSLDRPVLIWMETGPPDGQRPHGVVVRHPCLLGLYAVGFGPEGRFLVTEPSSATPLADFLERSPLTPLQAVRLAARLAQVIESYHEQGSCHGRLSTDWVLIRSDLEPVLCPCGAPCRSDQDRADDIRALGKLLLRLLPARPGRGVQAVQQIGAAARRGEYGRALDLARDLDRAARAIRNRWRHHVTMAVLLAFATLPWVALAAFGDELASFLAVALAPSCVLLGYCQARTVVARYRLGRRLLRPSDLVKGLLALFLFTLPVGLVAAGSWPIFPAEALSSTLATADLLGCWLAGTCQAGLVTAAEAIYATLEFDTATDNACPASRPSPSTGAKS